VRSRLKIAIALGFVLGGAALSVSLAGAADPDLETKIDSAQEEASLIAERISSQSARITELQQRAADAAAREQQLIAQLEESTARSRELNDDLLVAEQELTAVRERYKRAVGVLADRLVAIYKGSEPDALTVILEADGYDDLNTRAEYLEALTDADERIAERVSALHDEVNAHYEEIAGLKAEIDEQARQLEASREEIAQIRADAKRESAELAEAKAEGEAALSELREKISGWELEVRKQAAEELGGAGEAFLGGPYAIPTYIVMCESGGNYRALNRSSMAGGAYQIIPSTWQAYGGQGRYAHQASKAEQDRIAGIIWREDGPGAWSCA
jgi:septal ring factor EnvC (AmiA/AmiB activator)